jgi:hypothetical protein
MTPTERDIDEMLNDFRQTSIIIHANDSLGRGEKGAEAFASSITQAKQAIEAHYQAKYKRLISEAKPEILSYQFLPVTIADCKRGLDHYEANLLKALEEV